MTIEEAIEILENERPHCGEKAVYTEGERCEAYDMAISALREQDVADTDVGKMTNADRIRAMSDEELAELIDRETDSCAPTGDCEKMSRDCKACWLEWLQQPAEEDDHEN